MSGQAWTVIISPCLTRRLCLTTRLIRTLPSSRSSSANTIKTVSLRILPLTKTVSPRNSCKVSIVLLERAITELSSLTASVTLLVGAGRVSLLSYHTPLRNQITIKADLHQRVGLLLLLQNSCRRVQLLYSSNISIHRHSAPLCYMCVVWHVLTSLCSLPEGSLETTS